MKIEEMRANMKSLHEYEGRRKMKIEEIRLWTDYRRKRNKGEL
jgi:hypothetical protein